MPQDIALAIIINLLLILVFSWAFFWVILSLNKKTANQKDKSPGKKQSGAVNGDEPIGEAHAEDKLLGTIRQQKQQQLERVERVGSQLRELEADANAVDQIAEEIGELETQLNESLTAIDLHAAQAEGMAALKDPETIVVENNLAKGEVIKLQNQLNIAHSEAQSLRADITKISQQNHQLQKYRTEHREMSNKVADYIEQNRKSVDIITGLKQKLDLAQLAADEARAALEAANGDTNDETLQTALQKAEQERQALEDQYKQLLGQLEEAEKVSEELERSQKECAQLEQAYLALVAEVEEEKPEQAHGHEQHAQPSESDPRNPAKANPATAATAAKNVSPEALDEIANYNENWLSDAAQKTG